MKRFTFDDFVEAQFDCINHEYKSDDWICASKKADAILVALLCQKETYADAVAELVAEFEGEILSVRHGGKDRDNAEVRHLAWLLEQAGAEEAMKRVMENSAT